jgi:hypothetical protein
LVTITPILASKKSPDARATIGPGAPRGYSKARAACDELKPPFVIVDPRAGHGPGIGGFKADSEIGVAFKAGHPCYFIGFLPSRADARARPSRTSPAPRRRSRKGGRLTMRS